MPSTRRIKKAIAIVSISIILLLIFLTKIWMSHIFNRYDYIKSYNNNFKTHSKTKTILFWNSFFGNKRWGLPNDTLGPEYLRNSGNCNAYDCIFTNNQSLVESIADFDAILFHTAQPFPIFNKVPHIRDTKQLYIFANMEAPGETKHYLTNELSFYNFTMTYRLDSDLIWPYQYIMDIASREIIAPKKFPKWRKPPQTWNDTIVWQLFQKKTKTAAWFVSHCQTISKREDLVEELRKYIDVDIYGKCGDKSCPYHSSDCDNILDTSYKFYLSFENALCVDYVTEKLYNAFKRNLIPVVFGGADYLHFIPPMSYINVEDFESVEDLALYLKALSQNPSEYVKYFWWRKFYTFSDHSTFCDLCEILHRPAYQEKSQTYINIENWWLSGSCRFVPKINF